MRARLRYILMNFLVIVAMDATSSASGAPSDDSLAKPIQEVLVTASKTGAVSLQDTPLAVTAFSEDAIERSGVQSVRDIALQVPGLTVTANEQFAQPYIRGIGSTQFDPGNESATAIHLDGVYLSRPVTLFTDFVDIERIEVIRGPQGTLYGRNATAGSINLITKKPTATLEGSSSVEWGSFDKLRVKAAVSGPIANDRLFGKVAFLYGEDNGFVKNLHTNNPSGPNRLGDEQVAAGRLSLRFVPGPDTDINFSADYSKIKGPNSILKPANGVLALAFGAKDIRDRWTVDFDAVPTMDHELWGLGLNATHKWSNGITLDSITGYRASDYFIFNEEDGFEFDVVDASAFESQHQISQELQLRSDPDARFSWLAGLFYFSEDAELNVITRLFGTNLGDRIIAVNTDAYAAFAQASYRFTEKATLTAGVRESYEEKTCSGVRVTTPLPELRGDWSATTPKLGLDYRWSDDLLVYASITQGFKSGACNPTIVVDPEYVWSYEVGAKADWFDGRLRTNGTVFLYDYTDLQVYTFQGASGAIVTSAPSVDIWGTELEVTAMPADELTLTGAVAYLFTEYSNFFSNDIQGNLVDLSGKSLPFAPEWRFSFTARYGIAVGDVGKLTLYGEYLWTDDIFQTQFNDAITTQRAYALVNANASFEFADSGWSLMAYVKNATNKAYYDTLFQYGFVADDVLGIVRPPRTYGLQATLRF